MDWPVAGCAWFIGRGMMELYYQGQREFYDRIIEKEHVENFLYNISLYNRKPWTGDSLHQPRKVFGTTGASCQEGQGACAVSQYYAHECHARQEIGFRNCPNWDPDLGTNILYQSLPIFTISGIFGFNIIQHIFGMPNINGIRSSWSNHNFSQQLAAQVVEILDARYSVFWQLPTIRGCDNPMLEDEREAGSTWSRYVEMLPGLLSCSSGREHGLNMAPKKWPYPSVLRSCSKT